MKRFTETTKWQDPWYRRLSPRLKCLWQFLCDQCDAAGVLDFDAETASFHVGEKIEPKDLEAMGSRVRFSENGKLIVAGFVPFQYGKLSTDCRPHKAVFSAIEKHLSQCPTDTLFIGYLKGTGKDKDKDKDKEGVQGEDDFRDLPAGAAPAQADWIRYLALFRVPEWYAASRFEVWAAKRWCIGKTPADWKGCARLTARDYENDGRPSGPATNGTKPAKRLPTAEEVYGR